MPGRSGRPGHASNAFVWTDWQADGLGYPDGFVFVAGMLNGAYVRCDCRRKIESGVDC